MKKILAFIILSVALVSCYDEYIVDYPITGIYFPYLQDVRTFVVGEGMKVEVGATMGGARENTFDRKVNFVFKDSLLPIYLPLMQLATQPHIKNPTLPVAALIHMPANYYTISDAATMVIKKGWHSGSVVIKPDSVNFLNDSVNTIISTYALPFYIQSADADTILQKQRTNVVGFKFENKLFGKYWHGGAALINRPGLSDTTIAYKTTIPTAEANVWSLTTASPQVLYTNGFYNLTTTNNELKVVLKGNNVYVSAGPTASFAFTADGVSSFNNPKLLQKRMLILKYKYTNAGNGWTYHCTDTIQFRNRLRDGINEWQDENPSHYTK